MPIEKKHIKIVVKDCIAKQSGDVKIICDSKNKYVADFEFDSEWNGQQVKTAVFAWIEKGVAHNEKVVINGNSCDFPNIKNANFVMVGAFAGDLIVTTGALVECVYSILNNEGVPADPTPDVYTQLTDLLNEFLAQGGGGGTVDLSEYQKKVDDRLLGSTSNLVDAINNVYGGVDEAHSRLDGIQESINSLNEQDANVNATIGDIYTKLSEEREYVDDTFSAFSNTDYELNKRIDNLEIARVVDNSANKDVVLSAKPNTEYYFGGLESLDLTLEDGNKAGDMIYLTYQSYSPATLAVHSGNAVFQEFVPNENSLIEMSAKWTGTFWLVIFIQTRMP